MLKWMLLHLYQDLFYSADGDGTEWICCPGDETVYYRSGQGTKILAQGLYFFFQSRIPFGPDFFHQNKDDLESFALHKGFTPVWNQICFRTLTEDGKQAFQIWIPAEKRSRFLS